MEWGPWPANDLGTWTQAWIEGFLGFLAFALLAGVLLLAVVLVFGMHGVRALVRRRLWCDDAGRDVEVMFSSHWLTRRPDGVIACTAFEPASSVACGRGCLDATARQRCQPPAVWWRTGG